MNKEHNVVTSVNRSLVQKRAMQHAKCKTAFQILKNKYNINNTETYVQMYKYIFLLA